MPDRWGRPTLDDGLNMMRTAMTFQNFSNQQKDFAHREKAWNEKETADKYFGMKVKGEDVPKDSPDYNASADLSADQMMNQKWQAGQVKQIRGAEETLANMPDDQVLNFQPKTYAEHIVAANRIKEIASNQQNRQAIDALNNKKAAESYKFSIAAFNEARSKLAAGDTKGASDELVKIGMITNNPFKAKPSADGKQVTLYWTKDGVDQDVETYPIDQALQVVQQHLNGEEFFKSHLQNREARKAMNEKSLLNPIVLTKGKEQLRAVRELDLNTNQVRWSLYDKEGNLYKEQPVSDLSQVLKAGWKPLDLKAQGEMLKQRGEVLKQQKTTQEIIKTRADIRKINAEADKAEKGGTGKPGKFRNDWWPQTASEKEGGDPNITEARAIVTKAYDTAKTPESQRLIANQVLPKYKKWLLDNKEQMVMGENGEQRPLNSQDLQNAFDHIAYDTIQSIRGAGKGSPSPKKAPGMIADGNIDLDKRPVVKNADGSISTELSFSIGTDKGEVLIPQIIDGKKVSRQEAIDHYKKTGENLGIFKDAKSADAYAEKLHQRQGKKYGDKKSAEKQPSVTSAGKIEGIEVGVSKDGKPMVKDGKKWRLPETTKEKQAVARLADWRSKVTSATTRANILPRIPMGQ